MAVAVQPRAMRTPSTRQRRRCPPGRHPRRPSARRSSCGPETLLEDRGREFARLIAREGGKPLRRRAARWATRAGFLRFYASEAESALAPVASAPRREAGPRPAPPPRRGVRPHHDLELSRPGAPGRRGALAAGRTAVVKPAEETPLPSAAALGRCPTPGCSLALPTSWSHRTRSRSAWSWSTEPAQAQLHRLGGGRRLCWGLGRPGKHVTLELPAGTRRSCLADADPAAAVEGAVASKFRNSGQTCVCLNRVYVERAVYDEFCDRFAERVSGLRAGDPLDESTEGDR